jgi:hypothetical protein
MNYGSHYLNFVELLKPTTQPYQFNPTTMVSRLKTHAYGLSNTINKTYKGPG